MGPMARNTAKAQRCMRNISKGLVQGMHFLLGLKKGDCQEVTLQRVLYKKLSEDVTLARMCGDRGL
jgi:hypothetical protein